VSNYQIKFIITGASGSFQFEFAIDPTTWESEGADHKTIIWGAAKTAVGSCFRPAFQKIHFSHGVTQEMEFEVMVEPNYTSYRDAAAVRNQPDSLKIFWGKKRTIKVKTVLYPETIEVSDE